MNSNLVFDIFYINIRLTNIVLEYLHLIYTYITNLSKYNNWKIQKTMYTNNNSILQLNRNQFSFDYHFT